MRVRVGHDSGSWADVGPSSAYGDKRRWYLGGTPLTEGMPPHVDGTGSTAIRRARLAARGEGHGRAFDYSAGCRCDLCREAHRAVEVAARERRRARTEQETAVAQ